MLKIKMTFNLTNKIIPAFWKFEFAQSCRCKRCKNGFMSHAECCPSMQIQFSTLNYNRILCINNKYFIKMITTLPSPAGVKGISYPPGQTLSLVTFMPQHLKTISLSNLSFCRTMLLNSLHFLLKLQLWIFH